MGGVPRALAMNSLVISFSELSILLLEGVGRKRQEESQRTPCPFLILCEHR